MNRIKRIVKRGIAFIISLITVITIVLPAIPVTEVSAVTRTYDPEMAKGYAGNMFKTYINGGQDDLKIQDITEEEFRAFGVLLSNYYIPLYSVANKLDEDVNLKDLKCHIQKKGGGELENFNTWEEFLKVWNKTGSYETSLMQDLLNKYKACFSSTYMKPLYNVYTVDEKKDKALRSYGAALLSGRGLAYGVRIEKNGDRIDIPPLFVWYDESGVAHIVFSFSKGTDTTGEAIAAFISTFESNVNDKGYDGRLDYFTSIGKPYAETGELFVSPFGDICAVDDVHTGDYIVIIPACLNPYAFQGNGEHREAFNKLYVNNLYMLSNLLDNNRIAEMRDNKDNNIEDWVDAQGNINLENVGAYCFDDYICNFGDGKNPKLAEVMKANFDSMVSYQNLARATSDELSVKAGLAVDGFDPFAVYEEEGSNGNIDEDKYTPTNCYLSAVQPLWAPYFVTQASGNCGIAMVSRSSLLDWTIDTNKGNITLKDDNDKEHELATSGTLKSENIIVHADLQLKRQFPWTWSSSSTGFYQFGFDWVTAMCNAGADGTEKFQDGYTLFYSKNNIKKSAEGYVCALDPEKLGINTRDPNYNWDAIKNDKSTENNKSTVQEINEAIEKYFWDNDHAVEDPCKAEETSVKNDKDTETKYLIISLLDRVKKMDAQTISMYNSVTGNKLNDFSTPRASWSTCFYQINMRNVISKIGLFGKFTDDNGDITNIKTINILDDGEGTLLKKTGFGRDKTLKINTTCGSINTAWTKPEDSIESVLMPEFLYTLDAQMNNNQTLIFGENSGPRLSLNRNLMTNIYWAYIEDIVGITAKGIKDGISNEAQSIKAEDRTFKHLPPIGNADAFKNSLFNSYDDSEWAKEDDTREKEKQNDSIRDKIHKILNIGETIGNGLKDAANYVTNWLKAMIDSLFIGWHNHMVGVDTSAGITGSVTNIGNATKSGVYSTAMGYMTTPTFNNLPITGWIMSNFTLIYVILMVFIVVILLMMVMTRARRLPQAILIFVCMAFLIVLPANMLNGAISVSNGVAEKTFSNKFQYWAVMQHAEYIVNQSSAKNENQAALLDNLDRNSEATKVGGVTLKWMAPKKWGIAEQIQSSAKSTKGLRLFLYLAGDVLDQEDYSNYQAGDTYIYRPYLAIFTEAHSLHNRQQKDIYSPNVKSVNKDEENVLYEVSKYITQEWGNLKDNKYGALSVVNKSGLVEKPNTSRLILDSTGNIYTNKGIANGFFRFTNYRGDSILRSAIGGTGAGVKGVRSYPGAYYDSYYGNAKIITDKNNMYKNNERIYDMYLDEQLMKALFTFDINDVLWKKSDGTYTTKCGLWLTNHKNANTRSSVDDLDETYYSAGVQSFFDYSESPYYYFYNVLSDMMIHTDNGSKISGSEDFLTLLLSDETFKVTNQMSPAYGEFKDYLDMEGLFKFVIPLLDYGNGNATEYFQKYGSTVERSDFVDDTAITTTTTSTVESSVESSTDTSDTSDVSDTETSESSESTGWIKTIQKDPQTKAEDSYNKHKQQLQAVYNMYCPWVDQFLAANSKSERIKSGYGWVDLINPCDPADYQYFGRPMAFSKAEAVIRGYKDYDLSTVETKIQRVLNDTYYDIIKLINYKDLTSIKPTDSESYAAKAGWTGNEILVSAAAMIATFHFNQEFSDNGFMSTNVTLYPQSYELKNMNFDAYLRIIMGNSMGVNQVSLMRDDSKSMTVYEEFIHETSVWSALVLIIEDLLAVFAIPLLKIMLITVIFVLALALAVSCIINKPENMIKIFLKTFIFPLFAMIAIFVLHTVIISWFIGNGSSAGLIDTHSISVTTGDPTVTLLLMIVVDLITTILMWKLLKFAAKSTIKYIQDIGTGLAALGKGTFSGLASAITAVAGVGTLAVGAASAVGGAVKATIGGAVGAGKAVEHKKEVHQERKLDKERNKLLKEGNKSGTGTGRGKTGTGGTRKSTGATGVGNNHTESMATDIKAIRQKLEKGFNPTDMIPTRSGSSNGTGTEDKKKINSKGNNATHSTTAMRKQDDFNKHRAGVAAEKLRNGSVEDRKKYASQTRAMTDRFEKLKKDNNAVFDKKSGKWTSDGSATATTKINRLYTDITKRRSAMYQATSPVKPATPVSSSVDVGTHGVRTGKHAGGTKRKKSKKNRKAKR